MSTAGTREIHPARARRRQVRRVHLILAGVATIAMLALVDAGRLDREATLACGSVLLANTSAQYPQTPPTLVGHGGIALDTDDDQALQQELQALQQMQQAEQQAQQQNEQAQLQAQQAEQQGQQVEQQANNP
jgi:hydrogenase maturation factor